MKASVPQSGDSSSSFPQPAPPASRSSATATSSFANNTSSSTSNSNSSSATSSGSASHPPKVNDKLLRNKDVNDFMVSLDDYAPTLPTEAAYYYLGKGGANIHDPRAVKMVSLAADKFMADILFDARQFNLLRQQSNNPRVKRKAEADASTLQFDDLVRSLRMRGVHIHRPAAPRDIDSSSSSSASASATNTAIATASAGGGASAGAALAAASAAITAAADGVDGRTR